MLCADSGRSGRVPATNCGKQNASSNRIALIIAINHCNPKAILTFRAMHNGMCMCFTWIVLPWSPRVYIKYSYNHTPIDTPKRTIPNSSLTFPSLPSSSLPLYFPSSLAPSLHRCKYIAYQHDMHIPWFFHYVEM